MSQYLTKKAPTDQLLGCANCGGEAEMIYYGVAEDVPGHIRAMAASSIAASSSDYIGYDGEMLIWAR